MGFFSPEIPENAKQTNCWRFFLMLVTTFFFFSIVGELIDGIAQNQSAYALFSSLLSEIFALVCYWIEMQHTAYVSIEVNDEDVNVRMGPCEWPLIRWFCSSQILKSEVVSIERKERSFFYDILPRCYCCPLNWCCCHKSYSAYYWPFCCNDTNWCGLCDGDSDSSVMVQFNLTQSETEFSSMCCKRCAPCACPLVCGCPFSLMAIWWCCVYNRIAVAVQSEAILTDLKNKGYPLAVNANASEQTSLVSNPGATEPAV